MYRSVSEESCTYGLGAESNNENNISSEKSMYGGWPLIFVPS